jgi:hypothetical protein
MPPRYPIGAVFSREVCARGARAASDIGAALMLRCGGCMAGMQQYVWLRQVS